MAWLRNKKTGGWFEIPDDKLDTNKYMNSFIRQKTNNSKNNIQIKELGSNNRFRLRAEIDNNIVSSLDYKEIDGQPSVVYIRTQEKYRNQGIATKLYQELQKKYQGKEIKFGELTEGGQKLINKIGTITRKEKNKDGFYEYYGNINI